MSKIILSNIEKRLRKLENKIVDISDHYEETDSNIEDLYDTINNIKYQNLDMGMGIDNESSESSESSESNKSNKSNDESSNHESECESDSNNKTIVKLNIQKKYNKHNKYNKYNKHNKDAKYIKDFKPLNPQLLYITKYIDKLLNEIPQYNVSQSISNFAKQQAITFYNKLVYHQPQLLTMNTNTNTNTNMNTKHSVPDIILEHVKYFLEQTNIQRSDIIDTFDKVETITINKEPKLFKIINSSLDPYQKKIAMSKLEILETMKQNENTSSSNEYFKLSQWIETFISIPFNIYKTPAYRDLDTIMEPYKYLLESRGHLDTVIYGQQQTKQHIIEILARMIRNPQTLGSVFAIHGEPGTGKTTLIKDGLSKIFGLPFVFISLGGAQDSSYLNGHGYCYEGSSCGKIIQSLKQAQCMNPIFYFDELDKVSQTDKGQEIINLLVHLTDYTQNSHFIDNYLDGITIDLSRATFVFSFNDKTLISPILLDRMELIKFKSYSPEEKVHIAKHFLLPNVVKNVFGTSENRINPSDIDNDINNDINNDMDMKVIISDASLHKIVNHNPCSRYDSSYDARCKSRWKSKYDSRCNSNLISKVKCNKNKYKYKMKKNSKLRNTSGVRYIKKNLERIISYVNVDMMINSNGNGNGNGKYAKKENVKLTHNIITISDKIVSDVLNF